MQNNKWELSDLQSTDIYKNSSDTQKEFVCEHFEELYNNLMIMLRLRISKWIMNDIQRILNKNKISISECKITSQYLSDVLIMIDDEIITESTGKNLLDIIQETGLSPKEIVEKYNLQINNDIENIENICKEIIVDNPKEANLYKSKPTLIGWFIGKVMSELPTSNPKEVKTILEKLLK